VGTSGEDSWVVLELNSRSEGEDPDIVTKSIRGTLGKDVEVFLPAAVTEIGGDRVVYYLINGYAFVRHTGLESKDYIRLEGTRFVQSALTGLSEGKRRIALVSTADIERMRDQLKREVDQDIGIGDTVLIVTGAYRNIQAKVIEDISENDEVQVLVALRSKQAIVTLPRSGLKIVERAPFSPIVSKIAAMRTWIRFSRPIAAWDGDPTQIRQAFEKFEKLFGWSEQGRSLYAQVGWFPHAGPELERLRLQLAALERMTGWREELVKLFAFVASYQGYVSESQLESLQERFLELVWFEDVQQRVTKLRRDVEAMAHAQAGRAVRPDKEGGVMFQNLLIDGHNLAFRCLHAPGLDSLADIQGRPTGVIVGFIRSLGALRKKHPDARVYVTWDGSN
jgi:hypothetical protein